MANNFMHASLHGLHINQQRTPTFAVRPGPIGQDHGARDVSDGGRGRGHYAQDPPYMPPRGQDGLVPLQAHPAYHGHGQVYLGHQAISPPGYGSPYPGSRPPSSTLPFTGQRSPPQPFTPAPAGMIGSPSDPGPYLRQKLNLPPNVPVTLAALPDFPPDVPPNLSLSLLAQVAIYGSPRKQLTLHEIHRAIEQRYEYFRHAEKWKDSLRHVLSLRNPFRNIERPMQEPGKGGYWTLDFSEGEGNKRVRKRGKSTGPRKYDQESGEEGDTDVESGSEYEDHRPYGHLYVDTASRIQQEFSPTPSPSSSSSRSSGGIPSTVAPGPTIFRRATMSASHPYPPSFPSHPPTHLQHQQGPVRDSRMLRGHSSLPPAHEQGVPRGGQGDRPWSPGRA